MPKVKSRVCKLNYTYLQAIGIALILCLVGLLLWHGNVNSYQATSAIMAQVRFEGEYRIADGPWQKIVDGEHIPSTKGDVTLRGNFHMLAPDGEYVGIYDGDIPIALYTDHINITIYDGENEPDVIEVENPLFGVVACGINWTAHTFSNVEPIELLIHNPHRIGNENAIDELLSNMALWANIDFENSMLIVKQNLQYSSEGLNLDSPKTKGSKRKIRVDNATILKLKEWQHYQQKYSKSIGNLFDNKYNLIFTNSFGKPLSATNFRRSYWRKLSLAAELPKDCTFHCLRHSHATNLLRSGVDIRTVSHRLGHANIQTTMIYLNLLPDSQELAVEKFADLRLF